mmetsp:Transcript_62046/g.202447  ORF Transcript_62046/g.202447 Transcript_62046/m.202447 type:complete len:638 (+) Transcript_62046:42-1955(+)
MWARGSARVQQRLLRRLAAGPGAVAEVAKQAPLAAPQRPPWTLTEPWAAPLGAAVALRLTPIVAGRAGADAGFPLAAVAAAAAAAAAALALTGSGGGSVRCEVVPINKAGGGRKVVLSADCGGTTTRLQLYSVDPNAPLLDEALAPGDLLCEEKFPNLLFKSLDDIIELFLKDHCGRGGAQPTVAVLAVAGVVTDNACRFTNLDWIVDGVKMSKNLSIPRVEVINDFVAQGYGMLTLNILNDDDVQKLNDVTPQRGAPIACIGAGTGLGQCFLVADPSGDYHCYPSEGGHVEFAPRGEGCDRVQEEMLRYLKIKFSGWNRISVERVVSGKGICNIYEFLAYTFPQRVDKVMHREFLHKAGDASVIARHAKEGSLCQEALDIFAACYGSQCGSMSIQFMPFRGLFITGGVSKKMSHIFEDKEGIFMSAYGDKGRVSPLLDQVPLYLVKNDDMGQRGAHRRAVQLLKEHLSGRILEAEESVDRDRDQLVAPRGFAGEADGHAEDIAELVSAFRELAVRNRRLSIDKEQEDEYEPVFKTMLWRLPRTGSRMTPEDWMHREMWIAKNGSLCYKSHATGEGLVYWTKEDLANATIGITDESNTSRPWTFHIEVEGFQPSFFSAESQEGRDLWIQQLKEIQKK